MSTTIRAGTPASTGGAVRGGPVGAWTSRLLAFNVVAESLIVVTGGVVRLTGSGLGCPTWPQCVPGSYVPVVEQEEGFHKYIEFGNRTLTGFVGLVALAALVAVLRARRPDLLRWVAPLLLGILAQALIGGIVVHTDLAPVTVVLHFLVSAVLVAVSTALWMRAREAPGPRRSAVRAEVRHLARFTALVAAVVIVLGTLVTGSGPHSGDADSPSRLPLDPRTVSWLHADVVMAFCGLVIGCVVALRLAGAGRAAQRRGVELLVVTLAQGTIGYVQYFTGLPEVLVAAHMAGACVLVVAVTRLLLALTEPVAAAPRPPAATVS
ncbi:COX15/CtaA family protein [Kineococcus glutinatus]|uniref:COX15/CtaA family protein n=1 Tax=Kineococcus glutinatus TaxID=1070872 RepID=A0ABP9I4W8_9ACTN